MIFRQVHKSLRERLTVLHKQGIDIRFADARFNIWNGSFSIDNLKASVGKDSVTHGLHASIPLLVVKGIQLIPFITSHTLKIEEISIYDPLLIYNDQAEFPNDKTRKSFLENIQISNIRLANAEVIMKDSLGADTIMQGNLQLEVQHLGLQKDRDSLIWNDADLTVRDLQLDMPASYYNLKIKNIRLMLSEGIFQIDSALIKPKLGKRAFMRKVNKQTDRIAGLIPKFSIEGFEIYRDTTLHIHAEKLVTGFYLEIFRDKRYPFIKDFYTCLPAHFVQRLPFQFTVDSLNVRDSFISYEEFPEKGDSSGRVFFDKLNASIAGLHNQAGKEKEIEMNANAELMGTGQLQVRFTFPTDTTKAYEAKGSLRNFNMTRVNDMLGAAAQAKVKSGNMREMKFSFQYNMLRSVGEVKLEYENLKIISLRENSKNEQATSFIKTLLLNTFIIKKNMDEDRPDDDKTGTILFYRDTKRSVFNYWWKSLLSGIKSAYDIDKLESVAKKKADKRAEKAKRKS
ncbi:MAG TPA: DUF748 domain-containing protein [Ohtaekwangia sp.]